MRTPAAFLMVVIALLSGTGTAVRALTWSPGWTLPAPAGTRAVSAAERAEARRLGDAIDSPESARAAIRAWEAITAGQPGEPEAWTELASLRLLEGAAFRHRAKDRLACYLAALQASERAMATNPEFMRRMQQGQTITEAAAALGPREMGAMNFWVTGVFYLFRDCFGLFSRIANFRYMDDAKAMLQRMDAVDPAWEEYANTFSWGIYYLSLPVSRGGDRVRARECFDRAVARGGANRTLPRWGRGKYFYKKMGEIAAARADLVAVAASNLDDLGGNRSWNRYFKLEAAELLAR